METIQVVLDTKLLKATDSAAKRQKMNRSALIRMALREHLRRLSVSELEDRDRWGYERQPQRSQEHSRWEEVAAWPKD
ncbi:MAG: ribbon-helix-helix protein, CopG family [Chloroflexi bacterium]|nr:ribbon-helix-helix protein, CopG family [Chloroflexota bacterium]